MKILAIVIREIRIPNGGRMRVSRRFSSCDCERAYVYREIFLRVKNTWTEFRKSFQQFPPVDEYLAEPSASFIREGIPELTHRFIIYNTIS